MYNLYAEYIMWNAQLHESQAGIKIAERNVNNLRYETPWTAAFQASLFIINSWSLLKLMSIQPSYPLWSPSPPAFSLSWHQGLIQWVNSLHQVASASASILPMNIQD